MQYSLIENVTYCHFVQKTPQWQFGATCVNVMREFSWLLPLFLPQY